MFNVKFDDITFPEYFLEVGVFENNSQRKEYKKIASLGLTNAELMFIHENGSPLNHIPARPVLDMTLRWIVKSKEIDTLLSKAVGHYLVTRNENEYQQYMNKIALITQNYMRDIIYSNDGRLTPNSQHVANNKGGNHPLFDTGQLARSLTCRAVKI